MFNAPIRNPSKSSSVLAFKPRQVLLSLSKSPPATTTTINNNMDQKSLLIQAVALFLQCSGFSKTLKKFLSEAQIQNAESTIDLEEAFSRYLEICYKSDEKFCHHRTEASQDIKSKDKEKDKKNSPGQQEQVRTESKEHDDGLACEIANKKGKDKKKKKAKLESDTVDDVSKAADPQSKGTEEKAKELSVGNNLTGVQMVNKTKDKKKNKKRSPDAVVEDPEKLDEAKSIVTKKGDLNSLEQDTGKKENKGSKKRKRLASEEDATEPVVEKVAEESKRRKTGGSSETKAITQHENGEVDSSNLEKAKQHDEQANGNIGKDGEQSTKKNTDKKQCNGSAEPKTANRFQRVKIDEVVFSDERLQDNSYWAKDGAESGYGAKAQEVLGQVKGRGFRHEKTKKKRGSYRGGQIDLQSHSVKFNYSDEE